MKIGGWNITPQGVSAWQIVEEPYYNENYITTRVYISGKSDPIEDTIYTGHTGEEIHKVIEQKEKEFEEFLNSNKQGIIL